MGDRNRKQTTPGLLIVVLNQRKPPPIDNTESIGVRSPSRWPFFDYGWASKHAEHSGISDLLAAEQKIPELRR